MKPKLVYFAYPYTVDPAACTREVCKRVMELVAVRKDFVPFVPHIAFDKLLTESGQFADGYDPKKVFVLDWELEIITRCDGICFVPHDPEIKTAGTHWERAFAKRYDITIYDYWMLLEGKPFKKAECEP